MPAEAALPSFTDLQRELSPTSPRAWRFAVLRAWSRAGALLSDGLRIGYSQGFDSGPFMAHVYANRPSGRTIVGRAIDRRLLGRRTCVAFRDIRAIAERAVFDALRAERGPAPVVADLAAGPAPYLLSALTRHTRAHAIVGDTDPEALAAARRDAEAPFPSGVGFVSVYSRSDGIVDWRSCLDPAARHVEVSASHIGMSGHAPTYRAIARALPLFGTSAKAPARRRPPVAA